LGFFLESCAHIGGNWLDGTCTLKVFAGQIQFEMGARYAYAEKSGLAEQGVPALRPSVQLAQKMGKSVGRCQVLL
jgi:hypothetical protein